MDMMEVWHGAAMGQPHPVTLSGGMVHFQTDMDGLMQITGTGDITVCGKNLFDEDYSDISTESTPTYRQIFVGNDPVTASTNMPYRGSGTCDLFILPGKATSGGASGTDGVSLTTPRTVTPVGGYITFAYRVRNASYDVRNFHTMIEVGSAVTAYEPYKGTTAPAGTSRKSLVGINNVWSDSGSVTVTYWTH